MNALGKLGQLVEAAQVWRRRRKVARAVRSTTRVMTALHGRPWVSHIEHDAGFILIQTRPSGGRV